MMGDRPQAEESRLSPSAHLSSVKERLLAVGSDGNQDFGLIQQLYRKEALVYERAINELARRVGHRDVEFGGSEQMVTGARRLLGLTLVPFVRRYLEMDGLAARDDDLEGFRTYAREWSVKQLKSCAAAIAALTVTDYHRFLASELMSDMETTKLRALQLQIEQFESRPEAQPLVQKLSRQYEEIVAVIQSRMSVDPQTARSLSYLLDCTSEGFMTDAATAALIMRGNDSPGARAVRNPLQVLDVADVAAIFDRSPRNMTGMVSKIRRNAMEHSDISYFVDSVESATLWVRLDAPDQANGTVDLGDAS